MKKKYLSLLLIVILVFSLTACAGMRVDMPMELTIDGHTIVLGQTTMKDMTDLGYEVSLTAMPDTVSRDDKYVPFYYRLSKGAGNELFVTVYVPWGGSSDISAEAGLAPTEGVIRRVEVRTSTVEKVEAYYNGVAIKELTFETACEWGAKQDEEAYALTYEINAKDGLVKFASQSWQYEEFYVLTLQLSKKKFEQMQK